MYKKLNIDRVQLLPIIIFSSIVPLIVYLKMLILPQDIQIIYGGIKNLPDFFSYYKSTFIICSAVLAVIIFIFNKIKYNFKIINNKYTYLIYLYSLLIILSVIFSEHKITSLFGFVNLYEGCFVLISYLIMMIYVNTILTSQKQYKIVLNFLMFSAMVISIIGIFQYFGYDLLTSDFFSKVIIPSEYQNLNNKLSSSSEKYMIYSTLSNPNYAGSYMAMLLPIAIMLSLKADNGKKKIIYYLITALVYANLIGSRSKTGYLGTIVGLLILGVLSYKQLKYYKKDIMVLSIFFMVITIVMFMYINPKGSFDKQYNIIARTDIGNVENKNKVFQRIEYIEDGVKLTTKSNVLNVMLEKGNIVFKDENLSNLKIIKNQDEKLVFDNIGYKGFEIKFIPENNLVLLTANNSIVRLVGINGQGIKVLTYNGNVVNNLNVKKINIDEKFATYRGYIWSRTIPLLKNNIIIGSGPDNFIYEFPQDDIDGKYRVYGDDTTLVSKPHNMYLQIAINTGVLSLIVFILFVSLSLYKGLKHEDLLIKSICTGILSYLVAGIFNDSVVSVAPVFWLLLSIIFPNGQIYLIKK